MKMVKVTWVDSCHMACSWTPLEDVNKTPEPVICYSVGYVAYEDDNSITIAPHLCTQNGGFEDKDVDVSGVMLIPRCSVTSIEDLITYDAIDITSDPIS